MSTGTDIFPVPQLNPATGKMEPGYTTKSSGAGGGGDVGFFILLACIALIGYGLYWTVRWLIGLCKRLAGHLRARAEAKRLALLPEGVAPLEVAYPPYADASTRERCYAEAEQDRRLGRTNVQTA